MTKTRASVRRGPVILNGTTCRKRRRLRPQDALLGAEVLETPLPGRLLVLLSRLSRSERAVGATSNESGEAPACADRTVLDNVAVASGI